MQRGRKRLSLNKETLRTLTASQLDKVAGGAVKTFATDVCSYTNSPDCQTAYCTGGNTSYCATSQFC
jgi:hypothetical protein